MTNVYDYIGLDLSSTEVRLRVRHNSLGPRGVPVGELSSGDLMYVARCNAAQEERDYSLFMNRKALIELSTIHNDMARFQAKLAFYDQHMYNYFRLLMIKPDKVSTKDLITHERREHEQRRLDYKIDKQRP